ncbi:cytochrome P450 [Dactylonectria estremocensis]|uniref:Cytochrome P450 n=1 Tax=Dactylonectria estremocensis TaxID=1079267 RepID=A0A9P9DG86_9HYPO|nr:cytochrome P450 [Dactylonectria estremocensis]
MALDNPSVLMAGLAMVLTGLLYVLKGFASPVLDSLEPPLLKPRVPIVGHLISMIHEKSGFYPRLFKEAKMPICTLPILKGKLYVINSPSLIQSAMRNNDVSFDPIILEVTDGMFGPTEGLMRLIKNKDTMKELMEVIASRLMGEPLHKLNVVALRRLMDPLNAVESGTPFAVSDGFRWIRDITTEATARALFGEKNPLTAEHVPLLWDFDKGAALLALGIAPNLVAGSSVVARNKLNALFKPYYEAEYDQRADTSDLMRTRAAVIRREGLGAVDLSIQEILIPWVGSTNTIPTLFWLFVQLLSRPDDLVRVRDEVAAITSVTEKSGLRVAELDAALLEKQCPVLNACYQETLRFYVHSVGNRRVLKDTKLQDADGREYLLKKGVNVQWPPMVTHFLNSAWGDDAEVFNTERFLNVTAQDTKSRRGALLAFGGGKHLCPGRKFALTEILGFVGVVALGFEVEGLSLPESTDPIFGSAPRQAVWNGKDPGFELKRRLGWEDVTWTIKE